MIFRIQTIRDRCNNSFSSRSIEITDFVINQTSNFIVSGNVFSNDNFDVVYAFLKNRLQEQNLVCYAYNGYDFYLQSACEIVLKQSNYTLSIIKRGEGVTSLAKRSADANSIEKETTGVFLEFLNVATQ